MNPYYSYEFEISSMEELEELLPMIAGFYGIVMVIAMIFGLVFYVLRSVSLYSIAKRRGLNNPWLAWIPVGTEWMIGSISDQYRYVVRNEIRSRRKVLLALSLVSGVLSCVTLAFAGKMMVNLFGALDTLEYMTEAEAFSLFAGPTFGMSGVSALLLIVSIVLLVFRYMSMYDLFRSCDPNNAVVFLVLGILFSFLEPIFLMVVRKKDLGMPPRREPLTQQTYQYQQTDQEPWNQ